MSNATEYDTVELTEDDGLATVTLARPGSNNTIHGSCFGGGMELTMCADLRVAAESAQIGLPEHRIGLLPGWGGTTRLQRLVGQSAAKYVVFTAEAQSAERMREFGFVHEVSPDDEFAPRAESLARNIAGGPPLARKYTKRAMHDAEPFDEGLEAGAHAFGHLRGSEDLAEGIEAFLTGREPEFEGR